MMSLVLRPAALRRLAAPALPRALGRSLSSGTTLSTSSSASRFEGRGSTAVEEVNESLGFPREETDKAFVLGGATGQNWALLESDVTVHVAMDEALPKDWAVATRFDVESPPLLLSAAEDDALPPELADEGLFAVDPEALTFVVASTHPPESIFSKLDSLFPGARVMACAARGVVSRGGLGGTDALAGAVFTYLSTNSNRMLAATLADLAPHDFRSNAAMAADLFLPSATPCLSEVGDFKPADVDVPLFILDGPPFAEGEAKSFNIFESRYKLMIKECMDNSRPCLVVGPHNDAVGALCRVSAAKHDKATGCSTIVLTCERLALAPSRFSCRAEFGLVRGAKLEEPTN